MKVTKYIVVNTDTGEVMTQTDYYNSAYSVAVLEYKKTKSPMAIIQTGKFKDKTILTIRF